MLPSHSNDVGAEKKAWWLLRCICTLLFMQIFPWILFVLHIMTCDVTLDFWRLSQYTCIVHGRSTNSAQGEHHLWHGYLETQHYSRKTFSSALFIALAAKVSLCDPEKKVTRTFTMKSLEREWPSRISALMDIPVKHSDQLSLHVCSTWVVTLEKASVNLPAFPPLDTGSKVDTVCHLTLFARGLSTGYQGDSLLQVH